jgi:hypothetical protein
MNFNHMTTRELAKYIYEYSVKTEKEGNFDEIDTINYLSHLMQLHFEPDSHLGSKGFESTNVENRGWGC